MSILVQHIDFISARKQSRVKDCFSSDFRVKAKLRASLSGTFLQTLPETVTATEGALFISVQLSTDVVSAFQKVWVLMLLWKQPSTHVNMRRIHPRQRKGVPSRFKRMWFCLRWCKLCWQLLMTRLVLFQLFVTNLLLFEHQWKTAR